MPTGSTPTGSEIREQFLRFFEEKGHRRVHSSSLVPVNDPTLLFTNAGMNQFKDVFLGLEKRDYSRTTTSQKCVRAGGKHNDLENVGFTRRHHTFFEMLGNFSFGDYFKKDAVAYAWELITSPKWFNIAVERLYFTVFNGEGGLPPDDEAKQYWQQAGAPAGRIYALGLKDNFWAMGDTGPCGPCSEIHYDLGPAASDEGHTDCKFPCDCGRYVEIWNLVFMQFDRDASGTLNPLPKPSIDTGAGLERVTSVLQGVLSNYETDLFTPLIERAAELTGVSQKKELEKEEHTHGAASLRVIADHARATTFLINDGVLPSNEGRGYVLRKIMRRGIRHGRLLGQNKPFLHAMVYAVRDLMKDAYPELVDSADRIAKVVLAEENRFAHVMDVGLRKLEELIQQTAALSVNNVSVKIPDLPLVSGEEAFKLYDTFGLPFDFISDAVRDAGMRLDTAGFERAMDEQKTRARASWKGGTKAAADPKLLELPKTDFVGYTHLQSDDSQVLAIRRSDDQLAHELRAGEEGEVILDHTPFYAESGGQIGDVGWFYSQDHNTVVAEVRGCYAPVQGVRAHKVVAKQPIRVGDKVDPVVNGEVRQATMRNHTATHLLHAALRETLGKHVKQAGSLVSPNHLRFDFSHFTGVADEELQDIEDQVNREVLRNQKIEVIPDVPIDVAVNEYKAMALFGEKYGERVRVIKIGDFSTELCGGTHTAATGEIGLVKILSEGSVSSGVRRLEAISGEGSLQHFRADHRLETAARELGIIKAHGQPAAGNEPAEHSSDTLAYALRDTLIAKDEEIRKLRRDLDQMRMKSAASTMSTVDDKIKTVKDVKVLAHRVDNLERPQMRTLVDNLRNKLGSGVVVLGSVNDDKVALIVGVTKDLTGRVQAGKVISQVAQKVGGSGGGRPDLAEAGGKEPEALDRALSESYGVVESVLS